MRHVSAFHVRCPKRSHSLETWTSNLLDDVEEPEVEGVISRPDLGIAFELKILPKRLPNWMGGGVGGGLLAALLELLVLAAVGDRWGVKLILLRGPTAWLRSLSPRHIVVFEVWPDIESCERRAWEVRRSAEAGEYDNADPLSRTERRIVLQESAKN